MYRMNTVLEDLRERAGISCSSSLLANELLVLYDQRNDNLISKEEYEFLLQDIALVRAQAELANDEIACRFIVKSIEVLMKFAPI